MINSPVAKSIYSGDGESTTFAIGYQYFKRTSGEPDIDVWVAGELKTYTDDYTLSDDGLSVVFNEAPADDARIVILRDIVFVQESDYEIGRVDPDQIEHDFDLSVMRDQELRNNITWLDSEIDRRIEVHNEDPESHQDIRELIDTKIAEHNEDETAHADLFALKANIADLADIAFSGSFNDLVDVPEFATSVNGQSGEVVLTAEDIEGTITIDGEETTSSVQELLQAVENNVEAIPTIGNGTITIIQGDALKGTFTVNQDTDTTITLDAGGGEGGLPEQSGHDGEFLTTNGTYASWSSISYNSLEDLPTLFSGSYNDLTDVPTFATVATTGAYSDLTGLPTIPVLTDIIDDDSVSATTTWSSDKLDEMIGDIETLLAAI